ncbi:MAG: ribulose-phosphate 3-epimerase [Alphaproteobacteria bacterium]|nr:ribulose-phosphate 3-epimerase [Alphaproteobacteria bacterium]
MNLSDSCFLCLDIGTSCTRGVAHRIRNGKIAKSATAMCDNFNQQFAIKSVIDNLEHEIGTHFEDAYITGNFGKSEFLRPRQSTLWNNEHKITESDIRVQISKIEFPDGFSPIHIIPLQYDTPSARKIATPIGYTDHQLLSTFGVICYENTRLNEIVSLLHKAHIQYNGMFDPGYLLAQNLRKPGETILLIDLGAEFSSISIWNNRGVLWHKKLPIGMSNITMDLSKSLNIDFDEAERIKRQTANLIPRAMDRMTPADTAYDFTRGDVNDIVVPDIVDIIGQIKSASMDAVSKLLPTRIIVSGGGTQIDGVVDFIGNAFAIPAENHHADATITALSDYIWNSAANARAAYAQKMARHEKYINKIKKLFTTHTKKKKPKFIPIAPSTLCFNMYSPATYKLFDDAGISTIHVDIMDGFYVSRVAGGIHELKTIRANTRAHLHVHLMTENPAVWAANAIQAGADTIILSLNTSGVRAALRGIRATGRRAGVAINPDIPLSTLVPLLRDIDEVMVMAVQPGAAGQEFDTSVLQKILALATTRKKHGLKYIISVDGGINETTAQKCWENGADLLVSGSYLQHAHDFALAVQSLLKK